MSSTQTTEPVKSTGKPGDSFEPEGSAKTYAERDSSTEPGPALLLMHGDNETACTTGGCAVKFGSDT